METEATVWTLDNVCHMEGCLLLAPTIQPHSALQLTWQTSAVYSDTAHLFWPSKIYVTRYKEPKWMHAKQILLWKWTLLEEAKKPVYLSLTSVDGTKPTTNFLAKLPPIKP